MVKIFKCSRRQEVMVEESVKEKELQDVSQFGKGSNKLDDVQEDHWKSMSTHFTVC
jgi:hypothetical protein